MTYIEAILRVAEKKNHTVSVKLTTGGTITRTVSDVCKDKARFGADYTMYDNICSIKVHSTTIVECRRRNYNKGDKNVRTRMV